MQIDIDSIQEADEEHEVERYDYKNQNGDYSAHRMETEYVDDDEQAYDLYSIEEIFTKYIWNALAWLVALVIVYLNFVGIGRLVYALGPLMLLEAKYCLTNAVLFREEFQVVDSIWNSIHFMRILDCLSHILTYVLIILKFFGYSPLLSYSCVPIGFMQVLRIFKKVNSPNSCVTFAGMVLGKQVHNVQRWGKLFVLINLSIKYDKILRVSWTLIFWPGLAGITVGFILTLPILCLFTQNLISKHRDLNLLYTHFWLLYITFCTSLTSLLFFLSFSVSRPKLLILPSLHLLLFAVITLKLRKELTLSCWEFFTADNFSNNQFENFNQPLPIPGSQKLYIDRSLKNKLTKVIKQAPAALLKFAKPHIQTRSEKIKRRKLSRRTLSQVFEYPANTNPHVRSKSFNLAYDFSSIKIDCKFCKVNEGVNRFKECGHGELCAGCAEQYLQNKKKCYVCFEDVSEVMNEYNEKRNSHKKKFSFGDV
jgi:hypothetical protein